MKRLLLILAVLSAGYGLRAQNSVGYDEPGEPIGDENDQFDRVIKGLSGHKPIYFMYGWDPVRNAKFQLSLKYRFVNNDALSDRLSYLNKFYVAYTQKSFWDLESDSAPFADNNYNPEIFYLNRDLYSDFFGDHVRFDLQVGLEHESNGEDGNESRSWDRLYLWPNWVFGDPEKYHFALNPKIWAILSQGDEDFIGVDDYADIYGYGELNFQYGKYDAFVVDVMMSLGMESGNEAFRVNASYPMNRLLYKKLNFYLFAQAYYGEGETMLYADKHMTSIRLGIALYR